MVFSAAPPPSARSGDSYHFGRFSRPIPLPDIVAPGLLGRFRLKEWHYLSVTSSRWFFAFAVVRLGYACKVFSYLVDRESPTMKWEFSHLAPLSLGMSFAESSVQGKTSWQSGPSSLCVTYQQRESGPERGQQGWQVAVNLQLGEKHLHGEFFVEEADSLALLYRLPTGMPAYTHKASGLRTRGFLQAGKEHIDLGEAVAGIDWTRSVALRETRWQWSALQGRTPQGSLVGLNLSAQVYDDEQGDSQENALWLDGRVYLLGGVQFELPNNPRCEPWKIRSRSTGSPEVDLVFTPLGTREEQLNAGVIKSNFIQPYGTYQGTLCPKDGALPSISVNGLLGVVETHHSVW